VLTKNFIPVPNLIQIIAKEKKKSEEQEKEKKRRKEQKEGKTTPRDAKDGKNDGKDGKGKTTPRDGKRKCTCDPNHHAAADNNINQKGDGKDAKQNENSSSSKQTDKSPRSGKSSKSSPPGCSEDDCIHKVENKETICNDQIFREEPSTGSSKEKDRYSQRVHNWDYTRPRPAITSPLVDLKSVKV
jgi:hypothetical protein